MNKIIVQKNSARKRLDKFLAQKFPQYSRSYLQKNIKAGNIQINGKKINPNYKLEGGDKIEIKIKPPEKISLAPEGFIKLNIIYEDQDLLVINKPAGVVVHAGVKNPRKTLVNALLAHVSQIKDVGDEPKLRPGIVHRLDKDVSGIMVIAKTNQAFRHLKNQFKKRKVKKIYTALVWGRFKEKEGKIDLPLAQNPKNPAKMVAVRNPKDPLAKKAQAALTEFEVIRQFDKLALIKVYLRTGRRHQIRVHFKSANNPIVNDRLYGYRHQKFLGSGRIFLHSAKLAFNAPDGQSMAFNTPLPQDLQEILDQAK